jgi:hypothetical protein
MNSSFKWSNSVRPVTSRITASIPICWFSLSFIGLIDD